MSVLYLRGFVSELMLNDESGTEIYFVVIMFIFVSVLIVCLFF